jgi:predicted dehydrogenase
MLNLIIIGAGGIAAHHISAWLALGPERARIIAVTDPDINRAEELIRRFALTDAHAYRDYRSALSEKQFDAASICSPPLSHREISVDCLSAGIHVLLEKPMAPSLEDCDAMIAAAEQHQRSLAVVAQNRYTTEATRIKRLIEEGHCGKLLYAHALSLWWRGKAYYEAPWRGSWEKEGGGCTLCLAIHQIDQLLWIAGGISEISGFIGNINHPNSQVEDFSMAHFNFRNGAVGQLVCSELHHGEEQTLLFQTERAGVSLPFGLRCSQANAGGFPEPAHEEAARIQALYDSFPALETEGHIAMIADFARSIETGATFMLSGKTGRDAVEVVTGIYEAAVRGETVKLPLAQYDPFYTWEGLLDFMPRF